MFIVKTGSEEVSQKDGPDDCKGPNVCMQVEWNWQQLADEDGKTEAWNVRGLCRVADAIKGLSTRGAIAQ
jgi:hypothetical protein